MTNVDDITRRRSGAALNRILTSRPRQCPCCGSVLGPIMPLLDASGLVVGAAVECANNKCKLGNERGLLFVPDPERGSR